MAELHVRQGAAGAGGSLPSLSAAEQVARPGDTVIVHAGVYAGGFRPPQGTSWIAAEGERPVIDGGWKGGNLGADADDGKGVLVRYADVTLRGFEIRNVAGQGVAVTTGGHRFLMEDCEIHHTFHGGLAGNGLGEMIQGITIRGCHVHDIALSGKWKETPVNGCFLFKSCDGVLIEDTLIERGYGEGIAAGSRSRNLTFRRVTVRDTRHLLMYASNRAQAVLIEDCVLYQRGLEEFRQSDGQVGGGLVVGDEESGAKDDSWQHGENVTLRRCVVVNAGSLFEVRNQKKVGKSGNEDGYNTTIRNLKAENCTFVAGPDTRKGVVIAENEFGDGDVAGRFEANVLLLGDTTIRNGAAGVRFEGNGIAPMPPGMGGSNIALTAEALIAPFAAPFELDNYRPVADGAAVGLGALPPSADEPPPPDPEPEPEPDAVDWDALLERAGRVGALLATMAEAGNKAREQLAIMSLAHEDATDDMAALLTMLEEYKVG